MMDTGTIRFFIGIIVLMLIVFALAFFGEMLTEYDSKWNERFDAVMTAMGSCLFGMAGLVLMVWMMGVV